MNIKDKVQQTISKHDEKFQKAEQEAKAKVKKAEKEAAAKKKKELENENQVSSPVSPQQDAALNDEALRIQREQQEQQMDVLHSSATKAQFEDRNEYIHRDGSKVIDHEDGHLTLEAGRWSTPEDQATLAVESGLAKGWDTMSTRGFDEQTQSYMQAIGKSMGVEVKTEAEWLQQHEDEANKEDESENEATDELEEAKDIDVKQQEQLEPLAQEEFEQEHQEQTVKQQQEQEME
ncbi:hypothetical protein N9Y67_04135 [Pseudomonadota bacterium]|nr:hypothetical protein [Pseudomonadota bacterium]